MAKVSTSISIDAEVKEQVLPILGELGLDLSTAVGMFLRQTIRTRGIPFDVALHIPNAVTMAAMEEAEELSKNPSAYKRYSSFAELWREVESDA